MLYLITTFEKAFLEVNEIYYSFKGLAHDHKCFLNKLPQVAAGLLRLKSYVEKRNEKFFSFILYSNAQINNAMPCTFPNDREHLFQFKNA